MNLLMKIMWNHVRNFPIFVLGVNGNERGVPKANESQGAIVSRGVDEAGNENESVSAIWDEKATAAMRMQKYGRSSRRLCAAEPAAGSPRVRTMPLCPWAERPYVQA